MATNRRYRTIAYDDADYPPLLRQIHGAPLLLYVKGEADALRAPAIAIVGSRNPTEGGVRNAFEFAKYFGRCGFCIVSGLATGIDAAAHRGALAADAPTVAFLGHGIDTVYPAANRDLAEQITAHGVLVSEFTPGMPPRPALFPQRNRLISGMSVGTLVVEAARGSGSLITAEFAAEQGREVFAIPGSIHNPLSRGCHRLIGLGAKLVETAADVLQELGPLTGTLAQIDVESTDKARPLATASAAGAELIPFIGHDPVGVDELAERSGLTPAEVCSMLLTLELDGMVEKLAGGRYALLQ